mmetsp:Transcript_11605/g.16772  ORF Transcript_11605/g.16772 Transcript_11605/m.16772 type:complete len:81 (-) Transcript_11605:55-297(-)
MKDFLATIDTIIEFHLDPHPETTSSFRPHLTENFSKAGAGLSEESLVVGEDLERASSRGAPQYLMLRPRSPCLKQFPELS